MTIIMWRGAGILVIPIPIAIIILVESFVIRNSTWLSVGVGGAISGVLLYLFGKKFNVPPEIPVDNIYAKAMFEDKLKHRHSLYELPVEKWGILIGAVGALVIGDWLFGIVLGFSAILTVMGFIIYLLEYVVGAIEFIEDMLPIKLR